MELSQKEFIIIKAIARNFLITIKNGIFYNINHPILLQSINNVIDSINEWFTHKNILELKFTRDDTFIYGLSCGEKDTSFRELAYYLHTRGILSLLINNTIDARELINFVQLVKYDEKTIKEKGGLLKNIPKNSNIQIEEIDYSNLLSADFENRLTTEEEVYDFLVINPEILSFKDLPESKVELLVEFFKDSQKSASLLNKVYKRALRKQADKKMVQAVQLVMFKVCKHLEKFSDMRDVSEFKMNLMNVISNLHPDLISRLFEIIEHEGEDISLTDEITKGLSDSFIADFMESLIMKENSLNETLLRIFDKLTPTNSKLDSIVPILTDNLFQNKLIKPDGLSKIQTCIEELFRDQPENNFITEIYKITVDSVLNKKLDNLVYISNLSPLIHKFIYSMEEEKLRKERIRLLINLLWLEDDPTVFQELSRELSHFLPKLIELKDVICILEIVQFFTNKISRKKLNDIKMANEISDFLKYLRKPEIINQIVHLIPNLDKDDLEKIAKILCDLKGQSTSILLENYISNKNPMIKKKYKLLFYEIKSMISEEILQQIKTCDFNLLNEYFIILNELDPDKMHLIAEEMLKQKNIKIILHVLNRFQPETDKEKNIVFHLYCKNKNPEVNKRAALALLRTRDSYMIQKLFNKARNILFQKQKYIQLIKLCGETKIPETYPFLEKIFQEHPIFYTKITDKIRSTALKSMYRIDQKKTSNYIEKGREDRSHFIREICRKVVVQQILVKEKDDLYDILQGSH